jgi:hypothetical protein
VYIFYGGLPIRNLFLGEVLAVVFSPVIVLVIQQKMTHLLVNAPMAELTEEGPRD